MADLKDKQFDTGDEFVYALSANPNNGPYLSACTNGLYRSDDFGRTWSNAYNSLGMVQSSLTSAVACSPDYEQDHTIFAGVQGGVLRSTDGGSTWRSTIFPAPMPTVISIVVSPDFAVDSTLFAGTAEDGILVSLDGGLSWEAWNFGLLDMNILCLAISPGFSQDETLFAGTTTGLFMSTNGGRAWREVDLLTDFPAILSLAISPDFHSSGLIYAGSEEHGLFCTNGRVNEKLKWESASAFLNEPINLLSLLRCFPNRLKYYYYIARKSFSSSDGANTFINWTRSALPEDFQITAIAAPMGFGASAPVLVGGIGGKTIVI